MGTPPPAPASSALARVRTLSRFRVSLVFRVFMVFLRGCRPLVQRTCHPPRGRNRIAAALRSSPRCASRVQVAHGATTKRTGAAATSSASPTTAVVATGRRRGQPGGTSRARPGLPRAMSPPGRSTMLAELMSSGYALADDMIDQDRDGAWADDIFKGVTEVAVPTLGAMGGA